MARYIYYNQNPDGNKENDCVTRAISLASGIKYTEVRKKLFYTSRLLNCEKLCVCCYEHLLEDVLKYEPIQCDGLTVEEFADLYPQGTYLVRMNGHISTIINNTIYDIFDCRDVEITNAWKVE